MYNSVNLKTTDYLILEQVNCTFHNLILKHGLGKFFELRKHKEDGYDMSPGLVRIMRTIVKTIKSLERIGFYIEQLNIKEVYFCLNRGNVDDPAVKVFKGIRKRDSDTKTSHSALERMVTDLFQVVKLEPSPLVIQLKDKLQNTADWSDIWIHPVFLTTWEKIRLVNDASDDIAQSLDKTGLKMSSDPNLSLLGANQYGSTISSFIIFLRDKFRHYEEFEGLNNTEKKKLIETFGCNVLEFALYMEKIMPELWTTLTDVLF